MTYSLLRIALFLAATGVLWWVGMQSWLAPVVGAVVAFGLSYVLLGRQRDAAALHLAARAQRRRGSRVSDDAAAEDAEARDAESQVEPRRPDPGTAGLAG